MKVARSQSKFWEYSRLATLIRLPKWVTTKCLLEVRNELIVVAQRLYKQVVLWKSLRHPNVLQLVGVTMSDGHSAIVSEWMTNGDVNEYVKTHRDANRFELVGDLLLSLTAPVADGTAPDSSEMSPED